MHYIVYVCVACLYDLIFTTRHVGVPSIGCFCAIISAADVVWVRLQWMQEHEAFVIFLLYQRILDALARVSGKARHRWEIGCDGRVGVTVCGSRTTGCLGIKRWLGVGFHFGSAVCGPQCAL